MLLQHTFCGEFSASITLFHPRSRASSRQGAWSIVFFSRAATRRLKRAL